MAGMLFYGNHLSLLITKQYQARAISHSGYIPNSARNLFNHHANSCKSRFLKYADVTLTEYIPPYIKLNYQMDLSAF
ncbi:MAG: hypothetical protein EA364_09380 [Balneolaceae bacterium]|nr:MAG: hypothetical protein EA364_09380 [Balneolaceae bacterium]